MAVCEAIGSGSENGYVTNTFLYSLIEAGACDHICPNGITLSKMAITRKSITVFLSVLKNTKCG
jgi:Na+-translocating ferredoxin:NAD+ oxidoreductase RnfC subunit